MKYKRQGSAIETHMASRIDCDVVIAVYQGRRLEVPYEKIKGADKCHEKAVKAMVKFAGLSWESVVGSVHKGHWYWTEAT